jgi:hypothetical protein
MPLSMLTKGVMPRRTMLRGGAVALALPLLDAMVPVAFGRTARAAAEARAARRLVLVHRPLGTYHPDLVPRATGPTHETTRFLKSLEPFRGRYTVFSGMGHPGYPNDHGTEPAIFTGVPELNVKDVHNTISLDQVAARQVRGQTRVPFLALNSTWSQSLSWNEKGVPIPHEGHPADVFRRLFVTGTPEEIRREGRRLEQGASILDQVRDQFAALGRTLGAADRDRLDRFATSIREAEEQLSQEKAWSTKPKPAVPVEAAAMGKPLDNWVSEQERWLSLMHLALATDSTRVIVLCTKEHNKNNVPGLEIQHHDASHHGKDPAKIEQLCRYEDKEFETFGKFLGLLDGVKEDSGSLLDATQVLFTSNLGDASAHSSQNLPVVLAGGGYRHQGHVSYGQATDKPLCNLYVRMLRQFGVEAERFGSSDGLVGEI